MRKLFMFCALVAASGCGGSGPGMQAPTGTTETAAPGTPPEAAQKGLTAENSSPEGGTGLAQ